MCCFHAALGCPHLSQSSSVKRKSVKLTDFLFGARAEKCRLQVKRRLLWKIKLAGREAIGVVSQPRILASVRTRKINVALLEA